MRICYLVTILVIFAQWALSLKVLGVFPMALYSHYSLGNSLMTGLAEKGYDITLIAPYTEKDAKYITIELTGFHEKFKAIKENMNFFDSASLNFLEWFLSLHKLGLTMSDLTLKHENVQKLLASNNEYDIVIIDQFVDESLRGFCHHFNAHCIMFCSIAQSYWTDYLVGNPSNPAYMPENTLRHAGQMNLLQRTKNTFLSLITRLLFHTYILPKHNVLLKKYFPKSPSIQEVLQETPLVLLNTHVSTTPPVALVPDMIEIGGYHVNPPKQLPKDLQDFMNGAKDGVIYFSMGSTLKSNLIPPFKRDAILKAFSKLKQKVLWKYEDDLLPGQPSNLKILKWVPQQSVLAHPNVKLFITHGGFLSIIEAIYFGVPLIGIPIFGDQRKNVMQVVHAGYGVMLDYDNFSEEAITNVLKEILNNKCYTENVKNRSHIMHDQPMKPLDRAAFWIDYIVRHNGAKHLRSAAMHLAWYQLMLLDVFAILLVLTLLLFGLICLLIKCIFHKKSKKKIKEKKNK